MGMALLEAWDALRQPGWVRTADRVPEEKDGKDFLTHDIAWHREGESAFSVVSLADLLYYRGDEYDYWMPLPPLPENAGSEPAKVPE